MIYLGDRQAVYMYNMYMRTGNLLSMILDIGEALIENGAEVWRTDEMLNDLCEAYCLKYYDIFVVSNNIQATVKTWDGRIYTQTRNVHGRSYDLEKLDRLVKLAEDICTKPTGIDNTRRRLDEILNSPGIPASRRLLASMLAVASFTFFYDGDVIDALVGAAAAVVISLICGTIGKTIKNPLSLNALTSFAMTVVVLAAALAGIAHHSGPIVSSAVLLLVSGLGITNGISEMLHGNVMSGITESVIAINGASGIAVGVLMTYFLFSSILMNLSPNQSVTASPAVMVISCTIGCIGFALMFGVKGRIVIYSAFGAFLAYCAYMLVEHFTVYEYFIATLAGAAVVAFYANAVSRHTGIPAVTFLITSIFPLIPGATMIQTMAALVWWDMYAFREKGTALLLICIAISLGYIMVETVYKIDQYFRIKIYQMRSKNGGSSK